MQVKIDSKWGLKKAPECGINEGQDNHYITEGYEFRINLENRSKKRRRSGKRGVN